MHSATVANLLGVDHEEEKPMQLPEIVSAQEWGRAHEALLAKEKELTKAHDALAAERRRQPMVEIAADYEFDGPDGRVRIGDLFEGRRQLLLYHFWHPPDGKPCGGCSMFTDQVSELAHLHARDVTLAMVSTAPQPQIEAFKQRMGWAIPWYTVLGEDFQKARETSEYFKLDVYIRDGDRVFLTYETRARGVETLGSVWSFLDLTPLGRQEEWEDTPDDRPQGPAYSWWQYHDSYSPEELRASA
jgi:predicted dithiol-disulfide oxidoreductase (DUF899 family)